MPERGSPQRHRPMPPDLSSVKIFDLLNEILKAEGILLKRTDNIEKQCKAILIAIAKVQESIDNLPKYVTPELEAAINLVQLRAKGIDEKVPDNK